MVITFNLEESIGTTERAAQPGAYLEEIGGGRLEDWPFRQIVDALERLFRKVVVACWAA
ncbi:MAG: hypothetical protein ACREXJ_06810 [Gammaproteobacteria bacterium]